MAVFRSGESWCGRWRTGIDNDLESRLLGGSTLQSVVLCRPSTADERDKPLGFLSRPSATHFGSDSTRLNIAKVSKSPLRLLPPPSALPTSEAVLEISGEKLCSRRCSTSTLDCHYDLDGRATCVDTDGRLAHRRWHRRTSASCANSRSDRASSTSPNSMTMTWLRTPAAAEQRPTLSATGLQLRQ